MKKIFFAALFACTMLLLNSCRKQAIQPVTTETEPTVAAATAVTYDFVVSVSNTCSKINLTVNDCGSGSYNNWQSVGNCTAGNNFNGTVAGSGNPLLGSGPATFPNVGATYLIFANTASTKDVLQVVFKTGYNASHAPTVTYNASTRKFTIVNAGNPTYVTVSKFSYTGLIGIGFAEFC